MIRRWSAVLLVAASAIGCDSAGNGTVMPPSGSSGGVPRGDVSALPIPMPGTVLWLDGDASWDAGRSRWVDRSMYRHLFEGETGDPTMLPGTGQINGHGAVAFNGRNRLVLSRELTAQARDALTLGQEDFLLAVVWQPHQTYSPQASPAQVLIAGLPRVPYGKDADSVGVETPPENALEVLSNRDLEVHLGSTLTAPDRGFGAGSTDARVMVLQALRSSAQLRVNGAVVASNTSDRSLDPPLTFQPLYIGEWDFDLLGFQGLVAEVVLVKGPDSAADLPVLEAYLRAKYKL